MIEFSWLKREFPFVGWPRVEVNKAEYPILAASAVNYTQVFITEVMPGDDPIVDTLQRHLRAIEIALRYGRPYVLPESPGEITYTGGLLYWMERSPVKSPALAVFKRRGLVYRKPRPRLDVDTADLPLLPGCWLSDVGLIP